MASCWFQWSFTALTWRELEASIKIHKNTHQSIFLHSLSSLLLLLHYIIRNHCYSRKKKTYQPLSSCLISLLAVEVVNWLTMSKAVWLYVLRIFTLMPAYTHNTKKTIKTDHPIVPAPMSHMGHFFNLHQAAAAPLQFCHRAQPHADTSLFWLLCSCLSQLPTTT